MYIIEIKIVFLQFHIVGDFLSPKIMMPVSLLEQVQNFQHSASLKKFSLIVLLIASFKAKYQNWQVYKNGRTINWTV